MFLELVSLSKVRKSHIVPEGYLLQEKWERLLFFVEVKNVINLETVSFLPITAWLLIDL